MKLPIGNIALSKAGSRRSSITLTRDIDGAKIKLNAQAINFLVQRKEPSIGHGHVYVTHVISDDINEFVRETPQEVLELIYRENPYA